MAFQMLVERYQDYAYTICHSILKNSEEAEEAAQDAFIKAYRSLNKYESKSKFSTWLYTIAYRTSIDRYRTLKKHKPLDDLTINQLQTEEGQDHYEKEDIYKFLNQAIDTLQEEDGIIVRLFYLKELGIKEINKITGISESNIKIKLFRARKKLKDILQQLLPFEAQQVDLLYNQ